MACYFCVKSVHGIMSKYSVIKWCQKNTQVLCTYTLHDDVRQIIAQDCKSDDKNVLVKVCVNCTQRIHPVSELSVVRDHTLWAFPDSDDDDEITVAKASENDSYCFLCSSKLYSLREALECQQCTEYRTKLNVYMLFYCSGN